MIECRRCKTEDVSICPLADHDWMIRCARCGCTFFLESLPDGMSTYYRVDWDNDRTYCRMLVVPNGWNVAEPVKNNPHTPLVFEDRWCDAIQVELWTPSLEVE